MTTEDDFQRALDANPEDWQTRLVFADWLQERGDPRADGYRALGLLKRAPRHLSGWYYGWVTNRHWTASKRATKTIIVGGRGGEPRFKYRPQAHTLPEFWMSHAGEGNRGAWHLQRVTRREIEDVVALAFRKIPAKRRAELLSAATQGASK